MLLFTQKLVRNLSAAVAAGVRPDMSVYPEFRRGDRVVSPVNDPNLLGLMYVVNAEVELFYSLWPTPPSDPVSAARASAARSDLKAAQALLHYEIRRAFKLPPEVDAELRRGHDYPVLVIPEKEEAEGDLLGGSMFVVVSLESSSREFPVGCGDPNCLRCGGLFSEVVRGIHLLQ